MEEKDSLIPDLHLQMEQQKEETKQYVEQVDELKEYMLSQEACFTTQLASRDQIIEEANSELVQQQNDWNTEKPEMEKQCVEIRAISEQRRLDLYVAEAKLMQVEGANNAVITYLRKRLATT